MSRLVIELDPEQHRQIKTLATFSGMTIKEFVLSRVLAPRKEEGDATTELLKSEKNAERLQEAFAEPSDRHVVFESLEELEDALGI